MNICLFPSAFYPSLGGVEEVTRQLGLELQRQGHRIIVITNRWPRYLPESETVEGLTVFRSPMRFPGSDVKSHFSYHVTRGTIRRQLTDILKLHDIEALNIHCVSTQAHYATWAAKRIGLPLIVTLHGELTMDATQLYQRSPRAQQLMRTTLESAAAVTACSRQTLDEAETFMGRPWRVPASVIWNGVNLEELASAEPYLLGRPYILAIGRHVLQKGFDVLLRAFARYVTSDGKLELILAGDGPESLTLRQLVSELKLDAKVHLVGRSDRAKTASLFKGCEFFVLPSRHEPFGIVNMEAMAAGRAVIATRVGGVPEVVEAGRTGLLVPANDDCALAEAITRLDRDTTLRALLASAGQRRAAACDWRSVAQQYQDVYLANCGSAISQS